MFGELIKLLAEEPEKIDKAVIKALKFLLNLVIATEIYILLYGPISLAEMLNYTYFVESLLNGRALIVLLFYFISSYLIFPFLDLVGYGIVYLLTKIIPTLKKHNFKNLFRFLGIIKYSGSDQVVKPGRNFGLFHTLALEFSTEDAKNEVESLKNRIIGNVFNLYLAFFLIYLILFDPILRTPQLTIILIFIFLIIFLLYAGMHFILEYMLKHNQEIITELSYIKAINIIFSVFHSYEIFPSRGDKDEHLDRCLVFYLREKQFVIIPGFTIAHYSQAKLEDFINKRKREKRVFIFITGPGIINEINELHLKYFEDLIPIEFDNDSNLRDQLKNTIESIMNIS